jgi:translation initiation factor 3 subunit C
MAASPIPPSGHIPPAFLQTLVELEQGITSVLASEKNATKKMAAGKSKAVSSMRQALKKKAKEFELLLKTYNEVGWACQVSGRGTTG